MNILIFCKPPMLKERDSLVNEMHEESKQKIFAGLKNQCTYDVVYVNDKVPHKAYDLIVSIGGDGTLLHTSHFVGADVPVLAVNSAEGFSVGYFAGADDEDAVDKILNFGDLKRTAVTRLEVSVNDKVLTSHGLNDALFCHSNPAMTSRYDFGVSEPVDGLFVDPVTGNKYITGESQMSSGMWFATAVGSTAAIRSAGGFTSPHDSPNLQFLVREPYEPLGRRMNTVHGFVEPDECCRLVSNIDDGRVYVDGAHITAPVKNGDDLMIRQSSEPLTLLNFRQKD